ncbi:hypothetical protein DUNSADRAFT_6932 [Dunaliella salina]|uniref:Encoded protein n=1 Tax=Dunaliella salina TaxID=3046 RepID=A0ABQ7GMC4_DUNSA|nr:hypothetical protein DUNSADRAFT_6932 [Dunaliella salina]|eukprot:KAF5835751.1 hypothetical protein DUNSADRAFT_6932 [Dunaliella salina]
MNAEPRLCGVRRALQLNGGVAFPSRPVLRSKPGNQMASKALERPGSSRSKSGNKRGAQEISPSTGYTCDEVPAEVGARGVNACRHI